MRFEFDPVQDPPEMASAEAVQRIALELEQIETHLATIAEDVGDDGR